MCRRSCMRGAVVLLFGLPAVLVGWGPEPSSGADGTWSAAQNGNWSDTGNWLGGMVADGSGNTAYFNAVDVPAGGITATLDASRAIGNLTFGDTNPDTAGNWLLSGSNTLTLAGGTPTVTVEQLGIGAAATIATAIAGSSGLTKAGAGTLALTVSNNYSGGTTVTAGTLKGTIDSIRGDVLVNAGATVEFTNPTTNTIANKITGDGLFRVFFSGGGHVWITGITDFAGTVQLSKAVANGGKWTASGIGTLNAALIVDNLCQIYVAGPTAFNKGITVSGIGNTENRGAIRLASTLGGNITLAGDTTIGSENGTLTGNITSGVAGTQTLTFAGAVTGRSATVGGSITDGVGSIAVTQNLAGNTLILTGNNSYSGSTTISAGTLQVGAGGSTGTLGSGDVVNNGALVFNRSGELTVANNISGTGSLTKQGTGTVTLTGNNNYNGGTTVGGGALVGTVGSIRGTVQVTTGATVQFNATETGEVLNTIAGDGVLRLHLGGGTHTIMNKVSGITGTIWVSNTGAPVTNKWSVTQSVSADAAVLLDPGSTIFVFGGQTASFSKGITLSGTGNTENRGAIRLGGTLGGNITLVGSTTVGGEGGTITGNIASGIAGTQTLTFAGSGNGNATVSGAISDGTGTIALTQNRAGGTLTLTGSNSYSGLTTISAGTLQVGAGGATGTLGSGDVVNNGTLVFNRSGELTVANNISGTGSLAKQGAGTVTLSGSNSYTGGTTITAGTLKGTISSIRGDVLVNGGATVEFTNPTTNTIANKVTGDGLFRVFFSGGGHVWINGITDFAGTVQLSKAVANDGKWTASGIGTLNAALIVDDLCQIYVAGPTAFNKGITVSGTGNTENRGAIRLGGTLGGNITLVGSTTVGGEGGTITGNIVSGIAGTQTLTFAGSGNGNATVSGAISDGTGTIALTQNRAGGTLTLTGSNSYGGPTTISAGTLQVGAGGATGTLGFGDVVNNGALVFNRSGELTVANNVSGTGSLAKQGSGTLTLSGISYYTGATTVNAGTLFVTGALGQSAVAVNEGGTLGGSGTIGGAVTVNGGGWLSPGMSPGVLTMGSLTLESDSTTLMEINGVQRGEEYDGIDIGAGGDLAYGGTLSLVFGNSTPFSDGSTFDLFNFTGSVPSTFFDEVTSTGYYTGAWEWDNVDTFSLEFGRQTLLFSHLTGELTIVPEPSAFALAVLVLVALVFGRPWRRTCCRA